MTEWRGVCCDDGTGRNVYYVSDIGERTRIQPSGYTPEYFENGKRRFYFRGNCIRCKSKSSHIVLSYGKENSISAVYSFNLCENCLMKGISGKLRNCGNQIWEANQDMPLSYFCYTEPRINCPTRNCNLIEQSKMSQFGVLTSMKKRRNAKRLLSVMLIAKQYNIATGFYLSWGFNNHSFDEYFGEIDTEKKPHGIGVKFYADGTVYVGGWEHGLKHCNHNGKCIRPNGLVYDGSWMKGLKHGRGQYIYPDKTIYIGEFAKGCEHGKGEKIYPDGTKFEGRFRFGNRDGPGVLITPDGIITKKNFRVIESTFEPPLIDIKEEIIHDPELYQPLSLFECTKEVIAIYMTTKSLYFTSTLILNKTASYIKPLLVKQFLTTKLLKGGTNQIVEIAPSFSMQCHPLIHLSNMKLSLTDFESFIYLEQSNKCLASLSLTGSKLTFPMVDMLSQTMTQGHWPALKSLNLSFNILDFSGVQCLIHGILKIRCLTVLKLSTCGLKENAADCVSNLLSLDERLEHLDLSFNSIGPAGARRVAEGLAGNRCLAVLNLRGCGLQAEGAAAVVDALLTNRCLRQLCLVDNSAGPDVLALSAARLNGSMRDLTLSLRTDELALPPRYRTPLE